MQDQQQLHVRQQLETEADLEKDTTSIASGMYSVHVHILPCVCIDTHQTCSWIPINVYMTSTV